MGWIVRILIGAFSFSLGMMFMARLAVTRQSEEVMQAAMDAEKPVL